MLACGVEDLESDCEVTVDLATVPWVRGGSGGRM